MISYPLGKKEFRPDPQRRDLLLASYIDKAKLIEVARAPLAHDWTMIRLPSGELPEPDRAPLYNDVAGSCVGSMGAHKVNLLRQHTGRTVPVVTWEMVREWYRRTGYDPGTGAHDNGAYIREDLLKPWRAEGLFGTRCIAYALVNHRDPEEVALGSWLAGGLLGGYRLPIASQSQVDAKGRPQWYRPPSGWPSGQGPGSWGGHAMNLSSPFGGNTWGESVVWDDGWHLDCCDELWFALLDIMRIGDRAPNGFAWQDLLADAEARAAG